MTRPDDFLHDLEVDSLGDVDVAGMSAGEQALVRMALAQVAFAADRVVIRSNWGCGQ